MNRFMMGIYFYVHDPRWFHDDFVPIMTLCRRQRSFGPCLSLCRSLDPAVQSFMDRYCLGDDLPLISRLDGRISYDPHLWRHLVGELLLFGVVAVPENAQAPDPLYRPHASRPCCETHGTRPDWGPMRQAHFGTHDLALGESFYRPDNAGWNDQGDVQRLATFLAAIDCSTWTAAMLSNRASDAYDDGGADELAYARQCLAELQAMYRRAALAEHLIVTECI